MWLGIALFAHMWWLVVIYVLVFWIYYERIILAEEAFLKDKFGDVYVRWANTTPVIVPDVRHYTKPELPFSLRNVLRREYNGMFAVIVVMFLLEMVGEVFAGGSVDVDGGWLILLVSGFGVWVVLRSLKRHTTVLNVDGR